MTTTATETALLRAILTHPAEDTPRLIYADWLDENAETAACKRCRGSGEASQHWDPASDTWRGGGPCRYCSGTGRVSDGRRERAEFVRVQIGIAQVDRDRVAYLNDETDWRQCTGVSGSWCPNCGDCRCPDPEDRMDDAGCPLHRPGSPHDRLDTLSYRGRRLTRRATDLWREWHNRWFGRGTGTDNFGSALTPNEVDPRVRRVHRRGEGAVQHPPD